MPLAVVIVTYNSADVIEDCLDSLLASEGADLRVIVVDNKSPDNSIETVTAWAELHSVVIDDAECGSVQTSKDDLPWLTLLRSPLNKGFAGGVNEGLRWALHHREIDQFWIMNPDCMVEPQTARAFVDCAARSGEFSLMGGRFVYAEPPHLIQSDGGRVNTFGVCGNVNLGKNRDGAAYPDATALNFISGASMVASRGFVEAVGLLKEDYFLYYEEVDWAFRRASLPLLGCPEAVVRHHVGSAIGSPTLRKGASPFSNDFNFRNRVRFIWRHRRSRLVKVFLWSNLKALQMLLRGQLDEFLAAILGTYQLPPPVKVSRKVAREAWPFAFGLN